MPPERRPWGLLAEFDDSQSALAAARAARALDLRGVEILGSSPLDGLEDATGYRERWLPWIALAGAVAGATAALLLQWWANFDYPLNIGGRPLFSWPAFIPVAAQLSIFGAGVAAAIGMIALNGLPRLHHPLFNVDRFDMAGGDRWYMAARCDAAGFDDARMRAFFARQGAVAVEEVPQ